MDQSKNGDFMTLEEPQQPIYVINSMSNLISLKLS